MKNPLQHIILENFTTNSGKVYDIPLSYQVFGKNLGDAPIVLVNHALTGNSDVAGENGWWKTLIGEDKIIDTNQFSVLCFNIPGNGFDGFFIEDFQNFKTVDIARIFLQGLNQLQISKLFAIIGGSVGGSIGWEMLGLKPDLAEKFIPIACDFKTTDWLHSQCLVQDFLLNHPEKPLQKARMHAMLCYRTPESLNERFQRNFDEEKDILQSHDWLNFHGKKLDERFSLKAYNLMNQLLKTIDAKESELNKIQSEIHLVAVDSDLFFPAFEIKKCYQNLKTEKQDVFYHEIKSIHGHDAFLMEYEQLIQILKPIFYEQEK